MRAADRQRVEVVRLLLETGGADPALRQEGGSTALHIAAAAGDAEIVRLLVAHGADCQAEDSRGNTPAGIARLAGHQQIVSLLETMEKKQEAGRS